MLPAAQRKLTAAQVLLANTSEMEVVLSAGSLASVTHVGATFTFDPTIFGSCGCASSKRSGICLHQIKALQYMTPLSDKAIIRWA